MRFLVDQNLPPALADWLNAHGHVAEHVRVLGMASADDDQIADCASARGAVLISKDADFVQMGSPVSVIWVRIENATTGHLLSVWAQIWPDIETALEDGERLIEVAEPARP